MTQAKQILRVVLAASLGALVFAPSLALAQEGGEEPEQKDQIRRRESILKNQPPVRERLLFVRNRFEVAPAFESSVNAEFMHTLGVGLKLEYHFSDMFSVGAVGFYGGGLKTGLTNKIVDSLPDGIDDTDPTPSKAQFEEHLNTIPVHGAAYVTLTPWFGKLAAFSRFFVNFDFYFSAGLSVAQLKNECCSFATDPNPGVLDPAMGITPDNDPNDDPALNDGTQFGLYIGGGVHLFLSDFIALDLTVRSYLFQDNPSGLDFDADQAVTSDDQRFLNHLYMGIGVSFFLPTKIKRTP